jgi:hypothetical protein
MKTPWRFFVEMTSSRKPAPAQLALPGSETKSEDPASVAEPASLRVSVAETGGEPHKIDEVPAVPEASTASHEAAAEPSQTLPVPPVVDRGFVEAGEAEPDLPVTDGIALTPANQVKAPSPRRSQPKTAKRAKWPGEPALAGTAITTSDGQAGRPVPSRGSEFFDEVVGLDDEIRQLRAALARRLSSQNAQLRKMLERFDVS